MFLSFMHDFKKKNNKTLFFAFIIFKYFPRICFIIIFPSSYSKKISSRIEGITKTQDHHQGCPRQSHLICIGQTKFAKRGKTGNQIQGKTQHQTYFLESHKTLSQIHHSIMKGSFLSLQQQPACKYFTILVANLPATDDLFFTWENFLVY